MNSELYMQAMQEKGYADAKALQDKSESMSGTELYAEDNKIPTFQAAIARMNMLQRKPGFICKSTAGRVVKLLQPYDSSVYRDEPEKLPAQWGFKWSTDPAKALPFVAISTSAYMTNDCCTSGGKTWQSTIDNNVWDPTVQPQYWKEV